MLIKDVRNNCVLVGLREVSGIADDKIITATTNNGHQLNRGMNEHVWSAACKDLGIQLRRITIPSVHKTHTRTNYWGDTIKVHRFVRPSLAKIAKKYDVGTYLVWSSTHLLVIRDGRIIDHNLGKGRARCQIQGMQKVLNPCKAKKDGTILVFNSYPSGRAGATHARRTGAWTYCRFGEKTLEEVLLNTSYKRKDFKKDYNRGLVSLAKRKAIKL